MVFPVLFGLLAACSTPTGRPSEMQGLLASQPDPLSVPAPTATAAFIPVPLTQSMAVSESADGLDQTPAVLQEPLGSAPQSAVLEQEAVRELERGAASWYGVAFHGRRTASCERFDMHALTAAHRTLPFGTVVRVHSLVNGRDVDVRITDRGPFSRNRVIDLSHAAADALGMLGLGFKEVVLFVPESAPAESPKAAPVKRGRVNKRGPTVRHQRPAVRR